MKLEEGMYVRTKKGKIYKFESDNSMAKNGAKKYMVNCSYNIIDLIEVGDVLEINNEKYEVIYDESYEKLGILIPDRKQLAIRHSALEYVFKKYNVSIVTKEQFENMKYSLEG